jgi:hypothetical protein
MDRPELADAMRWHAGWGEKLGSPMNAALLQRLAEDVEAGGVSWRVLESQSDLPKRSLPLRFLGAIHRLVLEGALPELAQYYPSAGGIADADAAWIAMIAVLERHGELIRNRIPANVQTNEVGRCAALLPGFREVVRATGLPLRLLEIGCSAGLNLRFDHLLDYPDLSIVERRGCDLNPIALDEDGRLTLLSFVWPDQAKRFAELSRAIEIARRVPATIERADAIEWIGPQLANRGHGTATVVFHSVVWPYLTQEQRDRFSQIMQEHGERATADAPIAWLSMEPGGEEAQVDLTIWPGGVRRTVATSSFHGRNVTLCGDDPAHL